MSFNRLVCFFSFASQFAASLPTVALYGNTLEGRLSRPHGTFRDHDWLLLNIATASKSIALNRERPFAPSDLSIGYSESDPLSISIDPSCFQQNSCPCIHHLDGYGSLLGVDFGSEFSAIVDTFVLLHGSRSVPNMVQSPTVNYANYCIDGHVSFVHVNIGDADTASTVRVRFSTDGYMAPSFSNYEIDTMAAVDMDAVPVDVFEGFRAAVAANNIDISDENTIDCRLRQNMPDITYTIASDNDVAVVTVVLTHEDYIQEADYNDCFVMIRPSEEGKFSLGPNFMKHVALVFDYVNERIGFCEPI